MEKIKFSKIDFSYGALPEDEIIYAYGVDYDSLDKKHKSLFQIAWQGWTVEEVQMIIDKSKSLTGNDIYDYIVPGTELTISIDKECVYFFDWRTAQEEEDFNWTFNEFINFMEAFKDFISKNLPITKEQAIENLKNWINKTNVISYDEQIGFNCWDKELKELRDGKTKEVYVISFKTKSTNLEYDEDGKVISFFEGMYCFAYFDAKTLELLYISKKAGYIEVDGSY